MVVSLDEFVTAMRLVDDELEYEAIAATYKVPFICFTCTMSFCGCRVSVGKARCSAPALLCGLRSALVP